jgi:hypothetical protein
MGYEPYLGSISELEQMTGKLFSLQRPSTEHFVLAESFESSGGSGGDGNCVADGIEDLDGIPLCAVGSHVMIYQLDDVAATETMLRQIARQYHIRV